MSMEITALMLTCLAVPRAVIAFHEDPAYMARPSPDSDLLWDRLGGRKFSCSLRHSHLKCLVDHIKQLIQWMVNTTTEASSS